MLLDVLYYIQPKILILWKMSLLMAILLGNCLNQIKSKEMTYEIKILRTLEDCIFGQYEAEYLSECKDVVGVSEVVDKIPVVKLSAGKEITIDSKAVLQAPLVKSLLNKTEIEVVGLLSIFAQNPAKGCVLTITKIL